MVLPLGIKIKLVPQIMQDFESTKVRGSLDEVIIFSLMNLGGACRSPRESVHGRHKAIQVECERKEVQIGIIRSDVLWNQVD
jgi:hypothetical protein